MSETEGNREYKNDVFVMMMKVPEYALSVYNALHDTEYTDISLVEIRTLWNGVAVTVRNDATFIIGNVMQLYEHQSTNNPNMPLRGLMYYTAYIRDYIKKNRLDIYGQKLIRIPRPRFVVFYNGTEERPERWDLEIKDAYMEKTSAEAGGSPEGEQEEAEDLIVHSLVINVNRGHNRPLMEKSEVLDAYTVFVEKVREECRKTELSEAIDYAIKYCIENNYLSEFFRENEEEVKKMTVLDMTYETRLEINKAQSYKEGREEGRKQGQEEGVDAIVRLMQYLKDNGRSDEADRLIYDAELRKRLLKEIKFC